MTVPNPNSVRTAALPDDDEQDQTPGLEQAAIALANDTDSPYSGTGALTEAQMADVGKTVNDLYKSGDKDFDTALGQQQKIAQQAREALRSARARLQSEPVDNGPMWLAVAQAMGSGPSGGFSTDLARGFGAAAPYKENQRIEGLNRRANIDELNMSLSGYGNEQEAFNPAMIQSRLANARLKQINATSLYNNAIRHSGARSATGSTELEKLMRLRDTLPNGSADRKAVEDKIRLLTTRAPNANAMFLNNPSAGSLMAAIAEKQATLPAGMRSQAMMYALYQGLKRRHPNQSDDDIAEGLRSGKVKMTADMAAARSVGTTVGKVAYADEELQQAIPLARASSKKIPRGLWVAPQKLIQMAQGQLQSPQLRDLQIKVRQLQTAYELMASRSGNDVGKRAELHQLIMTADSPEVFESALKAFDQESEVAKKAGKLAIKDVAGMGEPAAEGGDEEKPQMPNVPITNAEGWKLHHDARGRWAYVSPDGKHFKVVQ